MATSPHNTPSGVNEPGLPRALRDKRRKHVLPKSNLTQVRQGVLLFKGGARG